MNAPENIKILVVEDDQRIAKLLQQFLTLEGFAVDVVGSAEQGGSYLQQFTPDLIILDLMLPGMDGVEFCLQIRPSFSNGILMLTAHEGEMEEVTALNAGIDDFVAKPIRTHVLLARINALLRRQTGGKPNELLVNGLEINRDKRTVKFSGEALSLSDSDFELLWYLACDAGMVVGREFLFQKICGREYDGLDRAIDMRVSKLRKHLSEQCAGKEFIKTLRQLGYILLKD